MSTDAVYRIGKSSAAFCDRVWPIIRNWCGGGAIVPVESVTRSDFRALDTIAGVDAWHVANNQRALRGIASRVQPIQNARYQNRPYNTFTVRYALASGGRTEYQKRLDALAGRSQGALVPALTVQAYTSGDYDGDVLSVAVIYTEDMYAIDLGHWKPRAVEGGNTMIYLSWDDIRAINPCARMYIWPDDARN